MNLAQFRQKGVLIIGHGNLGQHLFNALSKVGVPVKQIYSATAPELPAGETQTIRTAAEIDKDIPLCFLAIPDSALEQVSKWPELKDKLVLHCSGSMPLSTIDTKNRGVFYPLQSFKKGLPVNWNEIPVCVEADSSTNIDTIKELAALLSGKVVEMDSEKRLHLHLSAVLASNFTTQLIALAEKHLGDQSISPDLLKPLIRTSFEKALKVGGEKALTGPALRGDRIVIQKHLKLLEEQPLLKKIYKLLSESISRSNG